MNDDETNCQKIDVLREQIRCERELRLAFEKLMNERNDASKEAIKSAFAAADKASEKTEQALKEYKLGANEWRDTVRDAIATGGGKTATWAVVLTLAALTISMVALFVKR